MIELSSNVLILKLIFGTAFLTSVYSKSEFNCSSLLDFVCDNNRCILKHMRCDGYNDCLDLSDEIDCEIHLCQEPYWFSCKNKKCISKSFVCDNEDDCGDLSDEKQCEQRQVSMLETIHSNCAENEWQCSDRLCIPKEWMCNGEVDCLDASDENLGCQTQSTCAGFKCKNSQCIPKEWKCDKTNDCKDGSDEENCDWSRADCGLDKGLFQCFADKSCIKSSALCDGNADCSDKSDETTLCVNTSCHLFNCSHGCITTPTGIKCLCPEGYYLTDSMNCTDLNECEIYGICDQKCRNTEGSYECYCDQKYMLEDDKKTCTIKYGEAVMVFSTKDEIRGYFLKSQLYFPIAKQLQQAIGVAFDGYYVYWTEILSQKESIVRALEDGTHKQVLVTSGLGTPEDLAIDWITGNIYFTDSEMQHIGVCSNDGIYCTILVNHAVHKPRSIVLDSIRGTPYSPSYGVRPFAVMVATNYMLEKQVAATSSLLLFSISTNLIAKIQVAVDSNVTYYCYLLMTRSGPQVLGYQEMYWSDWGRRPEIARANMDGTEDISFVANEIYWPNGLAMDIPNQRLYWTDAKSLTIESIKLDGSGRRVILQGIVKHPYGLAVFENRIYWSDWINHSIESCDKFTGRDHHILIKQASEYIYGINIYHSAQRSRRNNPCALAFCSDICLLTGKGYSCACPHNKLLNADKHTCKVAVRDQQLVVATRSTLLLMQYQQLGKYNITNVTATLQNISALAYNSVNHSLFISDFSMQTVVVMDLHNGYISRLLSESHLGYIVAMDFDALGNNLYWCDITMAVVEVLNLNTMSRKVLLSDMTGEMPMAIALVAVEGIMFVALQTSKHSAHIDRLRMDGRDRTHVVEQGLLGPIQLMYDAELHRIFWADSSTGLIESTSTDGDDRHKFRALESSPVGIASLDDTLFWINRKSRKLYWAAKINSENNKKMIEIDIPGNTEIFHLISVTPQKISTHPCQQNNGNCSHLCLIAVGNALCACPLGMKLENNNRTCIKPEFCGLNEFLCQQSNVCISNDMQCDRKTDCTFGEDEIDCDINTSCPSSHFQCQNKDCIRENLICDKHYDCKDNSDEHNCSTADTTAFCVGGHLNCTTQQCMENIVFCDAGNMTCNSKQFRCNSGLCIPKNWECDQEVDCHDMSDEHKDCGYAVCKSSMFQCRSGLCINVTLKCNKINDCGDFSDELFCAVSKNETSCEMNEFFCYKNDSLCIPLSSRCNGSFECPQHEDEQGCSVCHIDEFECSNKKCIVRQWICDHVDDCGDNSDENKHMCLHEHQLSTQLFVCDKRFRCKNGQCIDMSAVCNAKADCSDGSDEDGACFSSCSTGNNPCSHICIRTPTGPQCYCTSGYKLRGDGRTCTDIKECSFEPPVCSQICNEISGSFSCSCYDDYILRSDGTSCKSVEESMSLIFVASNELYRFFYVNNTLNVLYLTNVTNITGIDVSVKKNLLYFSTDSGNIHRIHLFNQSQQYISDVGRPQNVVVEWISENIYFINDDVGSKSIRVCNFGVQYCADVLNINLHSKISALAVDAVNEYIFYLETSWKMFTSSSTTIYKCNLDGSNLQKIFISNSDYIMGLTYSWYRKVLYYSGYSGKIYKINYNGMNQVEIIANATRPVSLSVFDNHLYFYAAGGRMTVCPLFKDYQACKSYNMNGRFSELFVIFHSSRQPDATNICETHNCSYLCIPKNKIVQCLCSIDLINSRIHQCHNKQVKRLNHEGIIEHRPEGTETAFLRKPSFGTGSIVMIAILAAIIACTGIYYYFQKKRSGNFSISMRFQNPLYGYLQESSQEIVIHPGQHEYYNPVNSAVGEMKDVKKDVL